MCEVARSFLSRKGKDMETVLIVLLCCFYSAVGAGIFSMARVATRHEKTDGHVPARGVTAHGDPGRPLQFDCLEVVRGHHSISYLCPN